VGTPPISLIDARYLPPARHAGNAQVGIRPEDVEVSRDERADGVAGVVAGKLDLPMLSATILTVRVDEHEVYAQMPGEQSVVPGDRVWLTFRKYHLFDKQSGARLRSYPEPDAAA
jgi:ABC-type sugar transport system ATPase subunit